MLVREFISTIRNALTSTTLDNYIPGEYIYNVGLSISKLLIKRETDSRKIFKNTSIFTMIEDCIEMEESDSFSCTNVRIPKCKKYMRSKKPIPEVLLSGYGSLLFVYNLTRDKDYKEINPVNYKNLINQEYKPKDTGYFWIENNHLVIPDSEVEAVQIQGLFVGLTDSCGKVLDTPFPIIPYLEDAVIDLTLRKLSISKQIPKDENSNLNQNS